MERRGSQCSKDGGSAAGGAPKVMTLHPRPGEGYHRHRQNGMTCGRGSWSSVPIPGSRRLAACAARRLHGGLVPGNVEAVQRLRGRSCEVVVTDPDTTCH
jgi:hypothetical protein